MSKDQVMDLFLELKGYGVKNALRGVIDDPNTNEEVKNTAKYYMYWLEKADTIDDPEITKYNDYKEVK